MLKTLTAKFTQLTGLRVTRARDVPLDVDDSAASIIRQVAPHTLTSAERVYALIQAVRYLAAAQISGPIVECGVWQGGSMMAAALTLLELDDRNRDLYLFDTFEGMPQPTDLDTDRRGRAAGQKFEELRRGANRSDWCRASLDLVRTNVLATGYPADRVHFVKGLVQETIPDSAPLDIALLRLDTDWYESTVHELTFLFPRLVSKGILILDDYGHWQGSRRATDEYIANQGLKLLLNRIDGPGRIAIKP